jgi:hypothetical protein
MSAASSAKTFSGKFVREPVGKLTEMSNESALTIEPNGEKAFGPCDCCGEMTKRVWGFVYAGEAALAAYFVEWTPGHEASSANFDLIVGTWGNDADNSTRRAVSLDFRRLATGPAFMVIDACTRTVANSPLISAALNREEVIGTETATLAFSICDVIYLKEPRLVWLRD